MSLFGLLNYEDYILQRVATSSFAHNGLTMLLMYLTTGVLRFHLSIIICFIFSGTCFTDYIFPIIVNVLLSLVSGYLYQYTATHREYYASLSNYLITNYSKENFIVWKRIGLLIVFSYILLATALITINNSLIFMSTLQSLCSVIICDLIENRVKMYRFFQNWWYIPQVTKFITDFSIIEGYIKQEIPTKSPISPLILSKPPTPPHYEQPNYKPPNELTIPEPPQRLHIHQRKHSI